MSERTADAGVGGRGGEGAGAPFGREAAVGVPDPAPTAEAAPVGETAGTAETRVREAIEAIDTLLAGFGTDLHERVRQELRRIRTILADPAAEAARKRVTGGAPWVFERDHYRISFPVRERPTLVVDGCVADVVDCSERGVRVTLGDIPTPEVGADMAGRLRFRRGDLVDVAGIVVRVQGGEMALRLLGAGIPLGVLLNEQRFLRANYPAWE